MTKFLASDIMFWLFTLLAVLLAAYASYIDFKERRIPNYIIFSITALGVMYKLLMPQHLLSFIFSFSLAFSLSFLLWLADLWPAGDAKLFLALFFFLPAELYTSETLLFNFLANIFVPVFLFMFLLLLIRSKLSILKEALRYSLDPYNISMLSLILFGFVWFLTKPMLLFFPKMPLSMQYVLFLVFAFFVFESFRRFMSEKLEFFFLFCAFLRLLLDFKNVYTFSFIQSFLTMLAVFIFFRFFILHIAFKLYTYPVPITRLKPGMSPAELVVRKGRRYAKISMLNASILGFLLQKRGNIVHNSDFLSKEDVSKLKKLYSSGKLKFKTLLVHKTQPFAIFILLGFLITFFIKENIVGFILKFLFVA